MLPTVSLNLKAVKPPVRLSRLSKLLVWFCFVVKARSNKLPSGERGRDFDGRTIENRLGRRDPKYDGYGPDTTAGNSAPSLAPGKLALTVLATALTALALFDEVISRTTRPFTHWSFHVSRFPKPRQAPHPIAFRYLRSIKTQPSLELSGSNMFSARVIFDLAKMVPAEMIC